MNTNFKFSKAESVEIKITSTGSHKHKSQTQPNLRSKKVIGIEARSSQLVSTSNEANALLDPAFRNSAFLTLVEKGNHEIIKDLPLSCLVCDIDNKPRAIMQLNEIIIDWDKTYLLTPDLAVLPPVANQTITLVVYYID